MVIDPRLALLAILALWQFKLGPRPAPKLEVFADIFGLSWCHRRDWKQPKICILLPSSPLSGLVLSWKSSAVDADEVPAVMCSYAGL